MFCHGQLDLATAQASAARLRDNAKMPEEESPDYAMRPGQGS